MKRTWKFDEKFLREKIEEGEHLLRKSDIDDEIRNDIESMLYNFYDYLGENNDSTNPHPNLSLDRICSSLENKFNLDLIRLDLDI